MIPEHRAEPIQVSEWTDRALCRICDFYGERVPIQRYGVLRRWRHIR